jgi:hypothetical protein
MRALPPSTTESGMIPQMCASSLQPHRGGIRICRTDPEVGSPKVVAMNFPRFAAFLCDPVMPSRIVCRECFSLCVREDNRQRRWRLAGSAFGQRFRSHYVLAGFLGVLRLGCFLSKKRIQMVLESFSCLHRKTRSQRIQIRIRVDLRRIDVEFLPPNELGLLALFHNGVEEAAKDLDARLAHGCG